MGLFSSKPAFDTVLADKDVTLGGQVILRCNANAANLTASWKIDGQDLVCVDGKHTVRNTDKTYVLEIANVQEKDAGNYTLSLSNRSGTCSCSALVRVEIKEWRKVEWKNQDNMIHHLKTFKICNGVEKLHFLLYGPIGAGKSSTINTISTIFEGRQVVGCLAASGLSTSHTLHFKRFAFANEEESFPFTFNDVMGVENMEGVQTDDIISALKGHIADGYMFNSKAPITESNLYYNKCPSLKDQTHCLVYVIPADTISMLNKDFIQECARVSKTATDMEIVQVVFMTKVDRICPMIKDDLCNIYKSKKFKDNINKCSNLLGVPENRIFPVWNYHKETHTDKNINCLMLDALTHVVHWANDSVKRHRSK